jgi:cyclopropane-fatty-acyl-phospholipid synthase
MSLMMMATGELILDTFRSSRKQRVKTLLESLVRPAGIEIDGQGPASVRILHDDVYEIALTRGFTGLRDAYVDGLWDAERLDVITEKMLSTRVPMPWSDRAELVLSGLWSRAINRQAQSRNTQSRRHYDLGNDLYEAMLDQRMIYSCGYWRNATTLDEAQEAKLDLVCRKLGLQRGMRVLDIGCGWGGFAKFAAERYGVSVVGITISAEQARLATEVCAGLPVEIRVQDYRGLERGGERFERLVSIGMLEHVGYQNYRRYLKIARACLVDDGLFLLHTICGNLSMKSYDSWMNENIFPNAMLPSMEQLAAAAEGVMLIEDWHNLGPDYDPTLMAWFQNFDRAWPGLRSRYGERFYRIWKCYLLTCAGSFRARENQVWQMILSPFGVSGGYTSVR